MLRSTVSKDIIMDLFATFVVGSVKCWQDNISNTDRTKSSEKKSALASTNLHYAEIHDSFGQQGAQQTIH